MDTKKETKFVGFHVSIETDQWIRMNAVARNISSTMVLKGLIEKWKDDCEITEERLIAGILERIKTDHAIQSLKSDVDAVAFSLKWKGILSKKLSKPLVIKILKMYETSSTIPQ